MRLTSLFSDYQPTPSPELRALAAAGRAVAKTKKTKVVTDKKKKAKKGCVNKKVDNKKQTAAKKPVKKPVKKTVKKTDNKAKTTNF